MSGSPLTLRPHHGMCLAYFVGRGYSDAFSEHTARLLEMLERAPDTPVHLTVRVDEVCFACPNNNGGLCEKPEQVAVYDRAVLTLCGLAEGATLPFGTFAALVQERVLSPGLRRTICGGCQWDAVCSAQPSRWLT